MLKSKLIVIVVVLSLILVSVWFLFLKGHSKEVSPAIQAVPIDAAYVLEINHLPDLVTSFSAGNKVWGVLSELPDFKEQQNQLVYLDSLLSINKGLHQFLMEHPVLMSAHVLGTNDMNYLFALNLVKDQEKKQIHKLVAKSIKGKADIKSKVYGKSKIYVITPFDANYPVLHYSFYKGILLVSFSDLIIEKAIRQLNTDINLLKDQYFKKVSRTSAKSSKNHFFVNLRQFVPYLTQYFKLNNNELKQQLEKLGFWGVLETDFQQDAIALSGFTITDDSASNYLSIFKNQLAGEFDFEKMVPRGTAFFTAFYLTDPIAFKRSYKNFLRKSEGFYNYQKRVQKINLEFDTDIESLFYENLGKQNLQVYTNRLNSTSDYNVYWLMQVKDNRQALTEYTQIIKKYATKQQINPETLHRTINVAGREMTVRFFPIENLTELLMGELFAETATNFFIELDEYFVFGKSMDKLIEFAEDYYQQNTLNRSKNYQTFKKKLTTEANLFVYSNIFRSAPVYSQWLSNKANYEFMNHFQTYNKFEAWAIQFSTLEKMHYTNVYLNFNPAAAGNAQEVWKTQLDTALHIKPQVVKNHNNNQQEVVVQDKNNTLYLIDRFGKILWKKQLTETIISKIHQIDYYKNDKLQLLFNTKNHLHLLDRNGNYVEGYPHQIGAPATNGLSLFDYEKNKNYRIFIATADKRIRLFDKDGTAVEGWEFDKTKYTVKEELAFYRIKGKDFIVCADTSQLYILDRKGHTRLKPKYNIKPALNNRFFVYNHSQKTPFFITNGANSNIYLIYLNGEVKKMKFAKYSPQHYFDYIDISGDGKNDFVFFDNNQVDVYNSARKIIFSTAFTRIKLHEPNYYSFSANNIKLGFHCSSENKIYLLNSNGKVYKGFPLRGNTPFSIGFLSKNSGKFNVLVGNEGNFLLNYLVQ